jgi:hypothetical protein
VRRPSWQCSSLFGDGKILLPSGRRVEIRLEPFPRPDIPRHWGGGGTDLDRAGRAFAMSLPRPNPLSTEGRINLTVRERQLVTLTLHDILGRELRTIHRGILETGREASVAFDRAGLAAGVYLVRARGETFLATRRLVIAG